MKDSLIAGVTTTRTFEVVPENCICFMGDEGRVYATPYMIRDIEQTCRDFLLEHIDDNEDSVGTHVNVFHTGATVEGDKVEITITITEVKGRAITMEVAVKDSLEDVGKGTHSRFVVDKQTTFERLSAKREQVFGG